ncbi:MAG TPA: class I SAM-dependent methyltransferase, partial [Candidatus Bathyarchaeia archaeon]|nr:class I SAM-dependent methyltransferase [Candidatus Bathyarchaeia archaeon]
MQLLAKSVLRSMPSIQSAEFLDALLMDYPKRDFQIRLWDQTTWGTENRPRFTLVLKHPGTLRSMFSSPSELTLGEAYIYDDFDIEGDIEATFDLADYLLGQERGVAESFDLVRRLEKLPNEDHRRAGRYLIEFGGKLHSRERDRQAIHYHYDLPTHFYSLWLDPGMVYSCAYFSNPNEGLESAQIRKLDYICRKLRLRPGDRLLDIGCGWGALILHAASKYGAKCVGITLSVPQAEVARERLRSAGL